MNTITLLFFLDKDNTGKVADGMPVVPVVLRADYLADAKYIQDRVTPAVNGLMETYLLETQDKLRPLLLLMPTHHKRLRRMAHLLPLKAKL